MNDANNTIPLIEGCLARLSAGDHGAWDDLMVHAFNRLLTQCKRIIRETLSQPNPMITENAVLAETYQRLRTAIQNDAIKPTTAAEFFGLAARNIKWQVQDMLRKRTMPQLDPDIFDSLGGGAEMSATVADIELWQRFWDATNTFTEEEQQVFDLLWIHELSQYDAAKTLGIDRNRVDTIWRRIKLKIGKVCKDLLPA